MILYANRKIAQTSKIVRNSWGQYVLHILAQVLISTLTVLDYTNGSYWVQGSWYVCEALTNALICYIIWN